MPRPRPFAPAAQVRPQLTVLEERVTPSNAVLTVASSANPSSVGQSVTFTVTARPGTGPDDSPVAPTGIITFFVGGQTLGTAKLVTQDPLTSKATFTTSALPAGTDILTVAYGGDNLNIFGPTSATFTQTVGNGSSPSPAPQPVARVRLFAQGSDVGGPPVVTVFNADGSTRFTLHPFDPSFTGGARVAVGDVNGDGTDDIIVGAGPGGAPLVQVFSGKDGSQLMNFPAYEGSFTGGVYVAAGDINGDGHADIVTTADQGGGARVRVFSGKDGSVLADFFGIDDPSFRGGARIAVGDVNGDGTPDLVVAAGFGGGPRVAVFDGRSVAAGSPQKLVADFFAFEPALRNGTYVGTGDLDGDGDADLIFGGGPGGGPRVTALSGKDLLQGNQKQLANFFAGDPNSRNGVWVGSSDADGGAKAEIVAVPVGGTGGVFDLNGNPLAGFVTPTGFAAGIPAGTGSSGSGSTGTTEFNQGVVASNLKGTFTGVVPISIEDTDGTIKQVNATVTLTITSATAADPSQDPATAVLPHYTFSGTITVQITGHSTIDGPVTGDFFMDQFPKDPFTTQKGEISFKTTDQTNKVADGSQFKYDSGGVGNVPAISYVPNFSGFDFAVINPANLSYVSIGAKQAFSLVRQ